MGRAFDAMSWKNRSGPPVATPRPGSRSSPRTRWKHARSFIDVTCEEVGRRRIGPQPRGLSRTSCLLFFLHRPPSSSDWLAGRRPGGAAGGRPSGDLVPAARLGRVVGLARAKPQNSDSERLAALTAAAHATLTSGPNRPVGTTTPIVATSSPVWSETGGDDRARAEVHAPRSRSARPLA